MSAAATVWIHADGRRLSVSDGISRGAVWFSVFARPSGSHRRLVSPFLPLRDTRDQAQADLDRWAERNGCRRVQP